MRRRASSEACCSARTRTRRRLPTHARGLERQVDVERQVDARQSSTGPRSKSRACVWVSVRWLQSFHASWIRSSPSSVFVLGSRSSLHRSSTRRFAETRSPRTLSVCRCGERSSSRMYTVMACLYSTAAGRRCSHDRTWLPVSEEHTYVGCVQHTWKQRVCESRA